MKAHSTRHGGFDQWARTYDQSRLQNLFFDRVHNALLRALRPIVAGTERPRLLDLGCGTGKLLGRLATEMPAATLVGVDVAPGMIEVGRAKPELSGVSLELASAGALPFEDAGFDAVLSTISFHHWEHQEAGLREVGRVLRPGATLLLLDGFAVGPFGPLLRRLGRGHGVGIRGEGEMLGMLRGAGLVGAELRRVGPPTSPVGLLVARRP